MKIEYILPIIIIFIISFSFLPIDTDIFQRILYLILVLCVIGLVYMFLKKNGIGVIGTIITIFLLVSIYCINWYISMKCSDKEGKNVLLLYFGLAIGMYFFFNQQKKLGNIFINNTLGDCPYQSFALAIIFFCMIGSIVLVEVPVFILCLLLMYYIIF